MADGATAYERNGHRLLSQLVALDASAIDAENTGWAHIARTGKWESRRKGPFELTADHFAKMVDNFAKRATPLNFDYEHDTFKAGVVGPRPSSGEVLGLTTRNDGKELWALVRWTPRAANLIRGREYRSCSIVVDFDSIDRESDDELGYELLSVALTNDPFIDGLNPIQLTRAAMADEATKTDEEKKTEDEKALSETAPADGEKPADEDKKELADDGAKVDDVDANALVEAIASGSSSDKASVLGFLFDNLDALVSAVQKGMADGTKAEVQLTLSNKPDATTVVQLRVQDKQIKTLSTQLDVAVQQLKTLTDKAAAELKAQADAAAAEKKALIDGRVKTWVETGHVEDTDEDKADAVYLLTNAPEIAERRYAKQIVPIGKMEGASDDARGAIKSGAVTLTDGMSETEQTTLRMLIAADIKEADALKIIGDQRAGKDS